MDGLLDQIEIRSTSTSLPWSWAELGNIKYHLALILKYTNSLPPFMSIFDYNWSILWSIIVVQLKCDCSLLEARLNNC